jgi:hypothetical protein
MMTRVTFETGVAMPAHGTYRCRSAAGTAMLRIESPASGWLLSRPELAAGDAIAVELVARH